MLSNILDKEMKIKRLSKYKIIAFGIVLVGVCTICSSCASYRYRGGATTKVDVMEQQAKQQTYKLTSFDYEIIKLPILNDLVPKIKDTDIINVLMEINPQRFNDTTNEAVTFSVTTNLNFKNADEFKRSKIFGCQ